MADQTYQDFVTIVRALDERRSTTLDDREFLQAVQIASVVKMNSGRKLFNHSMVAQVISQYKAYFFVIRRKQYPEYAVNWDLISQDHPAILPPDIDFSAATVSDPVEGNSNPQEHPTDTTSLSDFCSEARKALAEEYKQAEEILLSNPVIVRGYSPAGDELDPEAVHIYEAELEFRIEDAPPIPEGVPVRVRWQYPPEVFPAKLLQWDLLNNKAYLAFPLPLDSSQRRNQSRIELTTHKLIRPLYASLDQIKTLDELVFWRLLGQSQPTRLAVSRSNRIGSLDESQGRAVRRAIEHDYAIIWGPPGTGKTHTIGCLICELVESGKRVLAASISNVAVDNMAIKFIKNMKSDYPSLIPEFESGRFLRFGYTRNDELTKDEYRPLFSIQAEMALLLGNIRRVRAQLAKLGNADPKAAALLKDTLAKLDEQRIELTRKMVGNAKVVFTTAAQVYTNTVFEMLSEYDAVIIDEVSMMAVPTFSVVAARARGQAIVAGDFRQLAPIAISQSARSHKYLHRSPFEWLGLPDNPSHPAMEMLARQRRMDPRISQWVSEQFYGGLLEDDPVVTDYVLNLPSELPGRLVLWNLSSSRHKGNAYLTQLSESHSRYNVGSADCVTRLATLIKESNPEASVAIISTYRVQAFMIRQCIDKRWGDRSAEIQVGTVHTYQGSEADVVIWDMVDTEEMGFGQPYRGDQGDRLTNVAISRAKKLVVVACDARLRTKLSAQSTTQKVMNLLHDAVPGGRIIDSWLDQ